MAEEVRFFDNRQRYLLFVTTTNEKAVIAEKLSHIINELKPVTDKLPEKYSHFAKAPEVDDDGDDLVVRFNKKSGDHLLSAELKGKKKKYFYFFNGSSWEQKPRD